MNNKMLSTIIGVIVAGLIAWFGYASWKSSQPSSANGPRQAIFLADGQVYFGHASSLKNQIITLIDVYYLQAQQNPQALTDPKATPTTAQQVNLIKLGEELHGPTDKMLINRDRITFMEDMKDDSQINQKIKDYLQNKAKGTPTP